MNLSPEHCTDAALLQYASEQTPGSDEHYDAIMELCGRGLKDPEVGVSACDYQPESKARLVLRPVRLACPPAAPQVLEAVVKMADCPYLSWEGHWAPHRILGSLEAIANVGRRVRVTIELLP